MWACKPTIGASETREGIRTAVPPVVQASSPGDRSPSSRKRSGPQEKVFERGHVCRGRVVSRQGPQNLEVYGAKYNGNPGSYLAIGERTGGVRLTLEGRGCHFSYPRDFDRCYVVSEFPTNGIMKFWRVTRAASTRMGLKRILGQISPLEPSRSEREPVILSHARTHPQM